MTFIKDFLAEAKKDSKLWTRLSKSIAFTMIFYGIATYIMYMFTGAKFLGGENMNIPLLIIIFFVTALLTKMFQISLELKLAKKRTEKDN